MSVVCGDETAIVVRSYPNGVFSARAPLHCWRAAGHEDADRENPPPWPWGDGVKKGGFMLPAVEPGRVYHEAEVAGVRYRWVDGGEPVAV